MIIKDNHESLYNIWHSNRIGRPFVENAKEEEDKPKIVKNNIDAKRGFALPMQLSNVKNKNNEESKEEIDERESLRSSSDDVEDEYRKKREEEIFEFLIFFDNLDTRWIVFLHLLILHGDHCLIKGYLTGLFSFFYFGLFGFSFLPFLPLIPFLILLSFRVDWIYSFLDKADRIKDTEEDDDDKGNENGASLAVLSHRVSHLNSFKINLIIQS